MKKIKDKKKGFTLIELLAVIVILAILVAAAVPAISKYLTTARQKSFVTDANTMIDSVKKDLALESLDNSKVYYYKLDAINELMDTKLIQSSFGENYSDESYVRLDIDANNNRNYSVCLSDGSNKICETEVDLGTDKIIESSELPASTTVGNEVFAYYKENFNEITFIPELYMAQDSDFSGTSNGNFDYIGSETEIEIPHVIKGVSITSYDGMFEGGGDVTKVVSTNKNVTSMEEMFAGAWNDSLDISGLETSGVTNMNNMFACSYIPDGINFGSYFDTSNVTTMQEMFSTSGSTSALLDISSFDTSKVTDMYSMFYNVNASDIVFGSNFDTSNITDMSGMFSFSDVSDLDLSFFDTSNVTNMKDMFSGFFGDSLNLSSFDTSNVTNMERMFDHISSVDILDLSSFDTSNVTASADMFKNSDFTTGYAKTQSDADRLNATSNKPVGLNFVVK